MFIQPEYIRRCYTRRAVVVLRIGQRTVRASEGKLVTVSRTVSGFGAMSAAMVEGSLSMIEKHFRDTERQDSDQNYICTALLVISKAPSLVLFPPIKPDACTKIQPSMPAIRESSSSLTPRHCSGSAFRLSKLSGET